MGCDPVDVAEIAKRAKVSKVTAAAWANGSLRVVPGRPFPIEQGRMGKVRWWNWCDVEQWIADTEPAWDRRGNPRR